ncbi:vigilin [Microplitis demolitor]|uniref:vigilin n=1 Tax=Microplitis demolitor TaxID=69319 RepID=UPI0004CCCCA4|nr:vigilin [Microplitis demolitor]XP_008546990.1 vigilin [Microplitis demolitor]XP_053592846.1 vigilin [Microplitis demolitor]
MQQQPVMEEGTAYEPPTYDETFPELPGSCNHTTISNPLPVNNSMRVGSSTITTVFHVPLEERKFDHSDKFGEGESMRTCQAIMKETNARIEISSSKSQTLSFVLSGKQSEVLEARRRILATFQTQASKQINIPKEHHRWILGKQRQRLNELEKNTATKINVPSVDVQSDTITITGTKEGIEKAEHEIKVISDEQSRKAFERIIVPKIYHPFIRAFKDNTISLNANASLRINIPPASVQNDEITIAGEKESVVAAKKKIESIYRDVEERYSSVSVEVPKSQHKYVMGPRNTTITEILQLTGVSVEMPSPDSPTGTITLRGPQEKLGQALDKVYEKANSVRTVTVEAPSWIHKYIIGRKGINIKKITEELPKVNVDFAENDNKIKIEGPPEEVEKVREQVEAHAQDLVNKLTFVELKVDPRYFKHIIGKNGSKVNRLKEETNVFINIYEKDGQNIIRIEGNQAGVSEAESKLMKTVNKLENEKEKDVIIDHRHYASVIGKRGFNIKEIREKFNNVQITIPGPNEKDDVVKIRGPKLDVDRCHKYLMKLAKELDENSYTIEVPIYKQFHKFIIGRGGMNIRKIREETQTKIELPAEGSDDEVIVITGKKDNVEMARDMIKKIQSEMSNAVEEEVVIPPKYYNFLIGTGGKIIHSIMEDCGGVTIKFPTAESKSDKVIIRGVKEDVEKAKQQLLEQTNEKQLMSFSDTVRAKAIYHRFIIGRQGANIKKIRESTGARVVFPTDKDEDQEIITIIGKKEAVEKAKAELESTIKEIGNIVEDEITIDPKHHKYFVARRGGVLARIADECGGLQISFPRAGVDSDRVVLKGSRECIEAAKQRMREIVHELESKITIECIIPQIHHRTVMGAKGCKVQMVTSEFDVQIKFPEREQINHDGQPPQEQQQEHQQVNGQENGETEVQNHGPPACDIIRITGQPENVEKAKKALLDLVPITVQVPVAFDLHRLIIGKSGRDVRVLMSKYDVHINMSPADQKRDYIEICGAPANIEEAKQAIFERVEDLEAKRQERALKSYELKFEVSPEFHPKIIGRGGVVIKKIRTDFDVQVDFPKKGDPEENIITITGFEKNTHEAKEEILKIVNGLTKEEIKIDSAVHSRLIGARGKNIRRIMEDYKVEIKFPRKTDSDPDLVVIIGSEENVADAREHLLNLEYEYLQDLEDRERTKSIRGGKHESDRPLGSSESDSGFVVKGGPWEQQQSQQLKSAPDTASVADFPTFVGHDSNQVSVATPEGPWGKRRDVLANSLK